jgi:DNA-binding NtrC family response regulator
MAREQILVVDDEPDVLAATQGVLESHGYKVCTAASAEEAYRYFQALHPRLLLIDFKLPGASGVDLLKWVRTTNPEIPSILITGFSSQLDAMESLGRQLGAFACLQKPLKLDQMLQTIQEAVSSRRDRTST